jgi:hypothetical protein
MPNLNVLIALLAIKIIYNDACTPSLDLGDLDLEVLSNHNKIFMPATETCSPKVKKFKRFFYCYHKGTCHSKTIHINDTHFSQSFYCICQNV